AGKSEPCGAPTHLVSRSSVMEAGSPCSWKVCATSRPRGFCREIGAHVAGNEHRSPHIDDVEGLDDVLLLALWIWGDAGGIFEVELPALHGLGTFHRLGFGEADEGQYAPVLARGDEWGAWSAASAVPPVANSHHEPG